MLLGEGNSDNRVVTSFVMLQVTQNMVLIKRSIEGMKTEFFQYVVARLKKELNFYLRKLCRVLVFPVIHCQTPASNFVSGRHSLGKNGCISYSIPINDKHTPPSKVPSPNSHFDNPF